MQLTPRDKRILQIAGVVLPLLLIVYFFVLRPDGGEDLALPSGPTGATGTTGVPTAVAERDAVPDAPRDAAARVVGRVQGSVLDPCRPRAVHGRQRQPHDDGGARHDDDHGRNDDPHDDRRSPPFRPRSRPSPPPTATTTTTPPPGAGDGSERPGNKILIGGHNVKLISVAGNGEKLDVQVDGKVYTVEPGATFDDNFKLVKIDGKCAKFLFGDQSFELCEK